MKKDPQHFAVIGLGGFGHHLAMALAAQGAEVLAIDKDLQLVEEIKRDVARAVCLDSTKRDNLLAAAMEELDVVIVTIGERDLEASILTTALLAQVGVPWIIARATNDLHEEILHMVGAHEVLNPEKDLAYRLATRINQRGLLDLLPLGSNEQGDYAVSELAAPEIFFGKSIAELDVRKNYRVTIVGIKRTLRKFLEDGTETTEEATQHSPPASAVLQAGDILVVLGKVEDIEALAEYE